MFTQTVTITQNSTPNIIIGRRSTYETQQVIFDVSWLIQTYGEGTAELLIKRPKDASAYPVVAALDGNTLTWTVSDTDTQDKGHGECEIYWYVDGGLAKSCICGITILRDIGDTTETAPDPYETWVDELARLGSETLANAQAAEQSANDAAQSASEADNSAAAALESEENALNSENAAKASEQAAAASKQGAEQSATEAAQSANAAESSAANAQESADNSSASADRAEQAAASIEGDTERAEAAAQTAQGAASDASGFAGTASTKATEAAGSAATAEQAATTATQKAADASAAATAAAGSASSASASATAAGNAQSAAETAQGKAEDAQEAAETAAQSIEDSAAQIDENTADILNLKSALNTKAGILRDTASGSVASFVPDSTIPDLLGVSVAVEPVQDLHGYDSPWPAGGGVNKFNYERSVVSGSMTNVDGTYSNVLVDSRTSFQFYVQLYNGNTMIRQAVGSGSLGRQAITVTATSVCNKVRIKHSGGTRDLYIDYAMAVEANETITISINVINNNPSVVGGLVFTEVMIVNGDTAPTAYAPYSNICPISGRDSVEVEQRGQNLLKLSADNEGFKSGAAYYTLTYGENSVTMTPALAGVLSVVWDLFTVTANMVGQKLSVSLQTTGGSAQAVKADVKTGVWSNSGTSLNPQVGYTITADDVGRRFGVRLYNTTGQEQTLSNVMVNFGATAEAFAPYSGTTYTIQLGDTVYGGTLDVTNGTLTVDRAMVDMGTLAWVYDSAYPLPRFHAVVPNMKVPRGQSQWATGILSSQYTPSQNPITAVNVDMTMARYNGQIYIIDSRFTDADTFKAAMSSVQLVYELATPIVIDLDPVQIATIANQTNNVWADAGDVTVEFAADLKTYIDNKIAAAVAAMS